ncbi:MAG: valine--tRNA ligase [Pseudomonadota bacterium]
MLEKTYDPAAIEEKWYKHWEEGGAFKAGQRPDADPFVIVIPPPNVTGSLHMGHALDNTLQDILARYNRLLGKDVLWQPGTDHAGIATQMVVERQLGEQGIDRRDLGREAFLEKVWTWKEESGGTITRQLRRLGASCDWSRERFTMDEGFSKAVIKVFVELYNQGLLYRDKRLVNWDPKFKTAISDLEVEQKEIQGNFWHFRYPLEDGSGHIVVATTRPETMLGDTAVAVHPEDERYASLVGKMVKLPITGRLIPIVADEHADPEQGSGAVKITPAHDFNDFEVGKRNDLPQINILDANAAVCQSEDGLVPAELIGMDRYDARKKVVEMIDAEGCLEKIEPKTVMMPYGDRSNVVIEPWLTDQWYVDAATLAKPAIGAVKTGKTKFVPPTWEKTYFNWMDNIQPWCVSRQLWWGHQIPAWYGPAIREDGALATDLGDLSNNKVFVGEDWDEVLRQAGSYYARYSGHEIKQGAFWNAMKKGVAASNTGSQLKEITLQRDQDVLDTWFSSGLWPFGTMGWPDDGDALGLEKYYPNSVLVTGFDIIFFWVARMMMQGIHFMNDVPFGTVYIHALVRDEHGAKMSKSKGNVVDPLTLIEKYGADALRFTLAAMETQGRDIKLSEKRVEGYRNFGTKLWNASRFCQMNGISASDGIEAPDATLPVNQWIIDEVGKASAEVTTGLDQFRFSDAANAIYSFTWNTFCDWYVELMKPVFQDGSEVEKAETQAVSGWALDQIFILLHPFMPFLSEELWHAMGARGDYDIIQARWPQASSPAASEASADINWIISAITAVRTAKAEANVPPGAMMAATVLGASAQTQARIERQTAALKRLARIESTVLGAEAPAGAAIQVVVGEATFILPLEGVIDIAAEKARLNKAIEKAEKDARSIAGRLSNEKFLAKAPEAVVAENRGKLAAHEADAEKLKAALARLG